MARSRRSESSSGKNRRNRRGSNHSSDGEGDDTSKTDHEEPAVPEAATGAPGATPPVYLTGPSQSPRDPNLYAVARLGNGIRLALNCTCSFREEKMSACQKLKEKEEAKKAEELGRTKAGTRSKCRRTLSDADTPNRKRSRANQGEAKDINCVENRVVQFNNSVLHVCETEEDGCYDENPSSFTFTCCGLLDPKGNRTVEGDGQPIPTPGELVLHPEEPPAEIKPAVEDEASVVEKEGDEDDEEEDDEEQEKKPVEFERNEWNRKDPHEGGEKGVDCSKSNVGKYHHSSVAVTLPWGPLYDPDDCPGASKVLGYALQQCSRTIQHRGDQNVSFIRYFKSGEIAHAVKCMTDTFKSPSIDERKKRELLDYLHRNGSFSERVRAKCWNEGDILANKKNVKFLSTLSKPDHPVRRCALGGKINKQLTDLSDEEISKGVDHILRNNCKTKYMTAAISAPMHLRELKKHTEDHFGRIGNVQPTGEPENSLTVEGEADPFDTPEFHKFYKILSCPANTCKRKCDEHYVILTFPLPAEAWSNYKTKPLDYLSHIIGHRGVGGLFQYLKKKSWMINMTAKCPETSLHRNQFVSLYQICIQLTELGFEQYEEVLETTFAYLKFLIANGPQRHIFKELQRIQAVDFHVLGEKLSDIKIMRSAANLSSALQIAVSQDVVLANEIMIEYNGPLLQQYMDLLVPSKANIMLVSPAFTLDFMTEEEPFLGTKYLGEEISSDLMSKLNGASTVPDFALPERNIFIPNSFCIRKINADDPDPVTKPDAAPVHISGDDFHDLYHLRDARYGTRVSCSIHFVVPVDRDDIMNSAKLALFYSVFKIFTGAYLYPADIAHACHTVHLTDFGVMVEFEANSDRIGIICQTLANLLASLDSKIDEEYFVAQKALFRQKKCCQLKMPAKLGRDIERVISVRQSWTMNEYVCAIESVTRDEFFHFINRIRHDVYFMLLVVGNAMVDDAFDLSESIHSALALNPASQKKIERVMLQQFTIGHNFIKLNGLDPKNEKNFFSAHYQIGLATPKNVVLSKLMEPVLRTFFAESADLKREGLCILVRSSQNYNVIEFSFEVYMRQHSQPRFEDIQLTIEELLDEFDETLCKLSSAKLCDWKRKYLCCCSPQCTMYTKSSDMNSWSQGVRQLNLEPNQSDLKSTCRDIKIVDVQSWFHRNFTYDPTEKDKDCCSEARNVSIIVAGNKPKLTKSDSKENCGKRSKAKKKCCTTKACDEIKLELTFENPNAPHCENGQMRAGKNGKRYIQDLEAFKDELFIYPFTTPK